MEARGERVAVPWLLFHFALVLPLVTGPICDRVDQRTIIKASMAMETFEAAALATLTNQTTALAFGREGAP